MFTNWRVMSRSFPFRACMASCRSSIFFPVTLIMSSIICAWTLSLVLDELGYLLGLLGGYALAYLYDLPLHAARGVLLLAVVEGLQRHPALHEFCLEDVEDAAELAVVIGQDGYLFLLLPLYLALRALEVVSLLHLLYCLVYGVVDFLHICL